MRTGDTVAIVSPSAPAAGRFPHRVERAREYLESLGLRVRMMPHAERVEGWVSAPGRERAADIHAAFLDSEVAVVLAAIGGNHSNQLLPHLAYELIREHPKVFQGYSDVTVLLWALFAHSGLRTFHGPALVPELGEFPALLEYTDRWLRAAWLDAEPLRFPPADSWTDELLDWNVKADLTRPRELRRLGLDGGARRRCRRPARGRIARGDLVASQGLGRLDPPGGRDPVPRDLRARLPAAGV